MYVSALAQPRRVCCPPHRARPYGASSVHPVQNFSSVCIILDSRRPSIVVCCLSALASIVAVFATVHTVTRSVWGASLTLLPGRAHRATPASSLRSPLVASWGSRCVVHGGLSVACCGPHNSWGPRVYHPLSPSRSKKGALTSMMFCLGPVVVRQKSVAGLIV